MKKFFVYALVLLVIIACIFCITSCGNEEHTHNYAETVVEPTCTAGGYTKYSCECGDSYTANEVPAAHKMTSVTEKAPTCTEDGHTAYSICSACNCVEGTNKPIKSLGHQYKITYVYPTITTEGERNYTCERCGDSKSNTINAISVRLPKVSEVIATVIGNASYKLELEENSKFVYVTEFSDYDSGEIGVKGFVFFELTEVVISGKDETLSAHLKLKVGVTETEVTGVVPANDIVASNDHDVGQIYLYVIGDDLSIEVVDSDGESKELTENLSNAFYNALGELVGIDKKTIEELAYIMSELERFAPVIDKIVDLSVTGLPTVSTEGIEHFKELISLFDESFIKESTDVNSNTVYIIDPASLKLFLSEIEDKTVAEYLAGVYGEDVVKVLSDFLGALPGKTVKEVADNAIVFVEETDISIEEVYTLIDLYIYFAADVEFSIENEIFTRYEMTFAEIIAENAGVSESCKTEYINSVNASFEQFANSLNSITFDKFLTKMFISQDPNASIIKDISGMIDALDDDADILVAIDEAGELAYANVTVTDYTLIYVINATDVKLTIVSESLEAAIFANESGLSFVIKEDGKNLASGSVTVTETTHGTDVTETVVIDMRDGDKDLLDYTLVLLNGEVISLDAVIREYIIESAIVSKDDDTHRIPEMIIDYDNNIQGKTSLNLTVDGVVYTLVGIEAGSSYSLTFNALEEEKVSYSGSISFIESADGASLTFSSCKGEKKLLFGNVTVTEVTDGTDITTTVFMDIYNDEKDFLDSAAVIVNDVVTTADVTLRGYYYYWDDELEDYGREFVTFLTVDYDDLGNRKASVSVGGGDAELVLNYFEDADYIDLSAFLSANEKLLFEAEITAAEDALSVIISDSENLLFKLNLLADEKMSGVEKADIVVNGYTYIWDEEAEIYKAIFEEFFSAEFDTISIANDHYGALIKCMGKTFIFGYEDADDGFSVTVTDESEDTVFVYFEVAEVLGGLTVDIFAGDLADALISILENETNGATEYVLDIDLDKLLLLIDKYYTAMPSGDVMVNMEYGYIEFDGAIKITIS